MPPNTFTVCREVLKNFCNISTQNHFAYAARYVLQGTGDT